MLSKDVGYKTYGFKFNGAHQHRVTGLYSIGRELRKSTSYHWDGLKRKENNVVVFQYTLDGFGHLTFQGETYRVDRQKAFFIRIPSAHQYYLPEESDHWEFIHITLFGDEAMRIYEEITDQTGPILTLPPYSEPISHIYRMLQDVTQDRVSDAYKASELSFAFLMTLKRYIANVRDPQEWPTAVTKAILFMEHHYAKPITLDQVVAISGLSKYHFLRLFQKTVHTTPIKYLTKMRINASLELLKNDALSIDAIAQRVGFSNGNYFGKVFRKYMGMSPGFYRKDKSRLPIDHLIYD